MMMNDSDVLKQYGVIRKDVRKFLIPCKQCGDYIQRTQFSLKREYICDRCKSYINKSYNAKIKAIEEMKDIRTEHEKRFDSAVERIAMQDDISKYAKAIELAESKCELYGSVPEAEVAILLLHCGYKIIPQQKIGNYRVDFAIPEHKVIIEVDGTLYHSNRRRELEREASINYNIGMDWKIYHIDSERLDDIKKLQKVLCEVIRGQH